MKYLRNKRDSYMESMIENKKNASPYLRILLILFYSVEDGFGEAVLIVAI